MEKNSDDILRKYSDQENNKNFFFNENRSKHVNNSNKPSKKIITEKDLTTFSIDPINQVNNELKRKAEAAKEYNEMVKNMEEIPEPLNSLEFLHNKVLIRIFKHVNDPDSPVYVPLLKEVESEGGKRKIVEDDFAYQSRGVVIKVSDSCPEDIKSKLTPGKIVWLTRLNPNEQWNHDRTNISARFAGFMLVPTHSIDCVEAN